ncbi:hypothetical protein Y032_0302g1861 [Ancylostoma ceylanicum]|uniref:Reverse transcriptase domain-containing protein n=1 Tax=Ancylostoma ceylanicum TaxID=53326 RepID=A0A016S3L0_9BILA|nr:hypothetical protein Y032_0302g1861 [Ancylostoma ceylanicum]
MIMTGSICSGVSARTSLGSELQEARPSLWLKSEVYRGTDDLGQSSCRFPKHRHSELQDKIRKWQMTLTDAGLRLNLKKTEIVSSIEEPGDVSDIGGTMFTQTKEFQYLGSFLSADGTVWAAVRGRIICA